MRNKICANTNTLYSLIIAGCLAALSFPAIAANDAILQLIELMHKKGSISNDEYELLKSAAKADDEANTEGRAEIANAAKSLPNVDTKGKLKISSKDGDFEWQPIGRVMVDYDWVHSDDGLNGGKLGSGAEFRRARLGMEGKMYQHWIWKLEFDFADATVAMKDAYVGYQDDDNWLKVGQQFIPFGFATMSSSKYMLFTERPLGSDNVLVPSRQIGISGFYTGKDNRWTFQTGVFAGPDGENPNDCLAINFSGGNNDECDEQYSVAARGTFLPYMKDTNHLVNVGAAVWYMMPQDSTLRVRQRPYFHILDDRFVDANFGANGEGGNQGFAADDVLAFNAEALAIFGPFSLGGEYTWWDVGTANKVGTTGPTPDINFNTYYVEASYFLTGESMNYVPKKAVYDKVTPNGIVGKGGIGAWQVAVRYDTIDLNDPDIFQGSGSRALGGEMRALGLGLNWYTTPNMRLMADFYKILETDRPLGNFDGSEPYGVTVRGQVFW
jgi:phosphate-selective porin OprO/OprP